LRPGKHQIRLNKKFEKNNCGIIPIGQICNSITTTGLKYNLKNSSLSFGNLISSSNEFIDEICELETSDPVLWITSLKEPF
jgi:thiamine pyrophosphokinase